MADYVSNRTGLWTNPQVWTPEGVPGAGDTATVSLADTVVYDADSTAVLGAVTVHGTLAFLSDASTQMVVGLDGILVKSTGTMNVGTLAEPIASPNTAELYLDPTGMTSHWATEYRNRPNEGVHVEAGGALNMYGDAAYYGAARSAPLAAAWTSGSTLVVTGDVSAWPAGSKIVVGNKYQERVVQSMYDDNGCTADTWHDIPILTVVSADFADGQTTIVVSEPYPIPPVQFTYPAPAIGQLVEILSRNITFGRLSAEEALDFDPNADPPNGYRPGTGTPRGQNVDWLDAVWITWQGHPNGYSLQSLSAGIYTPNGAEESNINCVDVDFRAGSVYRGNCMKFTRCVFRNGSEIDGWLDITDGLENPVGLELVDCTFYLSDGALHYDVAVFSGNRFYSMWYGMDCDNYTVDAGTYFGGCSYGLSGSNLVVDCDIDAGCEVALTGLFNSTVNGNVSNCQGGAQGLYMSTVGGDITGCSRPCDGCTGTTFNGFIEAVDWGNTVSVAVVDADSCVFNGDIYSEGVAFLWTVDCTVNSTTISAKALFPQQAYESMGNTNLEIFDSTIVQVPHEIGLGPFNYGVMTFWIVTDSLTTITMDGIHWDGAVTVLRFDTGVPITTPPFVKIINRNGVDGDNKIFYWDGTVEVDTSVTGDNGEFSLKATPFSGDYSTSW